LKCILKRYKTEATIFACGNDNFGSIAPVTEGSQEPPLISNKVLVLDNGLGKEAIETLFLTSKISGLVRSEINLVSEGYRNKAGCFDYKRTDR